jgi:MbtH protein
MPDRSVLAPERSPDDELVVVVVNLEEQYSVWPAHRPPPSGWTVVGIPASREECLDRIESLWTDLRPRSAR